MLALPRAPSSIAGVKSGANAGGRKGLKDRNKTPITHDVTAATVQWLERKDHTRKICTPAAFHRYLSLDRLGSI
jgi:hypothetical protein